MRDVLEAVWTSLNAPGSRSAITGRRVPDLPPECSAYLALDGTGRRHLLVRVPDGTEPVTQQETRGLEIVTDRYQVGGNPEALYIDLACADSAQNGTFSAVSEDLLLALARTQRPAREAVVGALSRWRAFWRAKTSGLSHEQALGLFGELWFLRRWLAPLNVQKISRWMATPRARHDFQWPEASVEVKTAATNAPEGPVHLISGLDQLADAESGQLYLFSLQVVDDALASNSLTGMVQALTEELRSQQDALRMLNDKLAAYGYNPADADNYERRLRVLAERLFAVGEGFPRLTRGSFSPQLPTGIGGIVYELAVIACNPWLVAASPGDNGTVFLR